MEVSTIHKTTLQVFPPGGLQMLSDHFLILGCAVLFEMYLLSSCSPIPPTIAWPKPEKNASAAFQKEKGYWLQTFQFTWCALPSAFHILMLDLTGETSEFVRQTAGHFWDCFQLKISIKPESQWCCSRVWKRTIGSSTVAQSIAYTQQRGLEGLEFWKDAWLQPHSKERSAPHTLSVDTRTTDMEKIKELASCWHCSS